MPPFEREEIILQGLAASPGVAHGPIFLFHQKDLEVEPYEVGKERRDDEIARFDRAILQTRRQISKMRVQIASKLGEEEAQIFDAHLLVLDDKALLDETIHEFEQTGLNIEYCFKIIASRFMEAFTNIDDEYIRERVSDIRDVTRRLLRNLVGRADISLSELKEPRIIVSDDLSPSETAGLEVGRILGIATDAGGLTSHMIIMARSIEVPAVVGLHEVSHKARLGDWLLIDGYEGVVIINPSEENLYTYGEIKLKHEHTQELYHSEARESATTLDGHELTLRANIEGYEDTDRLKESGAAGVGLFRTENIYLRARGYPSEEEQFHAYRHVVEELNPEPVTIRTLDLGGDKGLIDEHFQEEEENPVMGYRAIRFSLDETEIFKVQLRAILRASAFGTVKIMYPMISRREELIRARGYLEEAKSELTSEGREFDLGIAEGSMIEIPSAAVIADLLAVECDFFSIGTNDLIQYLLAVDRVNDRISHLFEPNHPAVLRTLKSIIDSGHRAGIPVGVCGEMAGDPIYSPLLFGLGADELSATPAYLPEIKHLIRKIRLSDAQELAGRTIQASDPHSIDRHLREFHEEHLGIPVGK